MLALVFAGSAAQARAPTQEALRWRDLARADNIAVQDRDGG